MKKHFLWWGGLLFDCRSLAYVCTHKWGRGRTCYLCYFVTSVTLLPLLLCYLCYFVTSVSLLPLLPCYLCYFVTSVTLLLLFLCYLCYFVTSLTLLPLLCYFVTSFTFLLAYPMKGPIKTHPKMSSWRCKMWVCSLQKCLYVEWIV